MWQGIIAALLIAQEAPVIRVPVRVVLVPTRVFSKEHRLIPGLKTADFRILDNGTPQALELSTDVAPVSVVIAIQTNRDVRGSVPFIAKVGSVMEAHLVGATGRAAVISYGSGITVLKPFGSGDLRSAFHGIAANGSEARTIDAGLRAIGMLKDRPRSDARVLLFIGQGFDRGSEAQWGEFEKEADQENVSIYALSSADPKGPLSGLIAATGGSELYFHRQHELEEAIGALGVELRSIYMLSYYARSAEAGRHTISVEVSVPGARASARPGYVLSPD